MCLCLVQQELISIDWSINTIQAYKCGSRLKYKKLYYTKVLYYIPVWDGVLLDCMKLDMHHGAAACRVGRRQELGCC